MCSIVFSFNSINVFNFVMPEIESNMYLMLGKSNTALVVDPNININANRLLAGNKIKKLIVLLTHEHYDHISGVNFLRNKYETSVICSKMCANNISDPKKNLALYTDVIHPNIVNRNDVVIEQDYICNADLVYNDKYEFNWEEQHVIMKCAPGHSQGGSLIFINDNMIFTGDNLVNNGLGVIHRWPGGSREQYLGITRPMIESLSGNTTVLPGHGKITTFDKVRQYLDFYQ